MRLLLILLLLFAASGCARHGISKESMALVDRTVTFPVLRENPDQVIGTHVQLGGTIAKVKNYPEGGELEVVDFPLARSGEPKKDAASQGRFLARSSSFLDPLIHKPGLRVTLVGEVTGQATRTLDNVQYRYPVILIKELHLWPPEEQTRSAEPRFHFGIGVIQGF